MDQLRSELQRINEVLRLVSTEKDKGQTAATRDTLAFFKRIEKVFSIRSDSQFPFG